MHVYYSHHWIHIFGRIILLLYVCSFLTLVMIFFSVNKSPATPGALTAAARNSRLKLIVSGLKKAVKAKKFYGGFRGS